MEERKQKEKELHNLLRDEGLKLKPAELEYYTSNKKWYSVVKSSRKFVEKWLIEKVKNKRVLDYCCGNGDMSIKIAKMGADEVVGIDISDVSIENCKNLAINEGVEEKIRFFVMDAENMEFNNNSFDIVLESGVLHHLNLEKAYSEIARVLKIDGKAICIEALGHNKIIHLYRKLTPHLRTKWEAEHILCKKDIYLATCYFERVEILGFFHLAVLAGVPLRNLPIFRFILSALELVDSILLKLPVIKWQAWQVVFVLSNPKK